MSKKALLLLIPFLLVLAGVVFFFLPQNAPSLAAQNEWREYLGGPDRNHYSTLTQINVSNVSRLKMVWRYDTRDSGQMQCNPIIVDDILYSITASLQPFALDAATGKKIWRWGGDGAVLYNNSRGVVYWEESNDKRILFTSGEWLYALDAKTGSLLKTFGENGRVSLKTGLGDLSKDRFVVSNTPGIVFNDVIIMPLRTSDGTDPALGHIQAFNIKTGKLQWVFHTIPLPNEYGYDTWSPDAYKNPDVGSANNWAGMAIDRKRGIVFVPTGSAAADYYGGNRKGENLFANCLIALDANTGKRIWHYQMVHHDILDRDPPAPPNLITLNRNGKKVDAVVQVTKQGYVFVFERATGKPLFPIEERKAPPSDLLGEEASPTQPFPLKPAPFARQTLTTDDINPLAENYNELVKTLKASRYEGPFTPHSKRGTIIFPGFDGGAEWGGAAADPDGILYVNSNEMAWLVALDTIETTKLPTQILSGEEIYLNNCAACHGKDRKGIAASSFPSLIDIGKKRSNDFIKNIITSGKNMMPGFAHISNAERDAVIAYLNNTKPPVASKEVGMLNKPTQKTTVPYRITKYGKFLDSKGFPAIRPPWGTLNAIDLNTGEYVWKIPFGEYPELTEQGITDTGSESYGGPVITAGGLLIIAGTKDKMLRIYDKKTGKLLWFTALPAAGFATPATYAVKGKQYIVIACGGDKLGAPKGESFVAFGLD